MVKTQALRLLLHFKITASERVTREATVEWINETHQ